MSELLKYARARDDQNFRWRIAAAMTLRAQTLANQADLPMPSKQLVDWVLENPMQAHQAMVTAVSVNAGVAANITVVDSAVRTDAVPDADIIKVVANQWDAVSARIQRVATTTGVLG